MHLVTTECNADFYWSKREIWEVKFLKRKGIRIELELVKSVWELKGNDELDKRDI